MELCMPHGPRRHPNHSGEMSETSKMGNLVRNAQNGHFSYWTTKEAAKIWPSKKTTGFNSPRQGQTRRVFWHLLNTTSLIKL